MLRLIGLHLKNLWLFDTPILESLICTNLFMDGKPHLYIDWRLENAFKVRITGHKTIYSPESTIIFKIPNNFTKIRLTYSNIWKKRTKTIELLKIPFEEAILSSIMTNNFKPYRKTTIEGVKLNIIKHPVFDKKTLSSKVNHVKISTQHQVIILKHQKYE